MKKNLALFVLLTSAAGAFALPTWEPFVDQSGNGIGTTYPGANGGSLLWGQVNASGEKWFEWANAANQGALSVIVTNFDFNQQTFPAGFPSGYPAIPTNSIWLPSTGANATTGQSACLGFSRTIFQPAGIVNQFGAGVTNTLFLSFLVDLPNSHNVGGAIFIAGIVPTNLVTGSGFGAGGTPPGAPSADLRFYVASNATVTPYGMGITNVNGAPVNPGGDFQAANFESSNNVYFVVIDYEMAGTNINTSTLTNDHAHMWISPAFNSFGAPVAPPVSTAAAGVSVGVLAVDALTNAGGFYVLARTGGTQPTNGAFISDLSVGTTWSYVTGGPEFSVQPLSVTNNGASTAILTSTAIANGGQAVNCQWQVNGQNLSDGLDANGSTISGSATSTLTIANLKVGDGASYTVLATDPVSVNNNYAITSAVAVLTVDPTVTDYPRSGPILFNGSTNLSVTATTATASLTYQWQRNGLNLTDGVSGTGTTYAGSASAILNLSTINLLDDGAQYDCAITNAAGGWVITPPMTLTVTHLLISSQPVNVNVNYNGAAAFSAAPSPAGSYSYSWLFNGNPLANGPSISGSGATVSGATTTNLHLSGLTYLDAGSYSLFVNGGSGNQVTSNPGLLTVNDPYILSQPASLNANAGSSPVFTVSAAGSPTLSYLWKSNGFALSDGGGVSGSQTASLTLSSTVDADDASYSVVVNGPSAQPVASAIATLTVFDSVALSAPLNSWVVNPGVHVAFAAAATGTPPFSYQWLYDGAPLAGATSSAFLLTNVDVATNGTYTVLITNTVANGALANLSASATLDVTPTLITLPPPNLVVARVGDGAQALNTTQGNTLYLDQFSPAGSYVATTMIPDSGPNALIVAGGSPDGLYESVLTSSSNDLYINFAGFNVALPNANSADLGSGSIRAIGGVSGLGGFSLALTNANLHSGGTQIRSATSTDGLFSFWTTGNANGLAYVTPSGGAIPDVTPSAFPDLRVIAINSNSGNLYLSGGSGDSSISTAAVGFFQFNGAPTTANNNPSAYENTDATANPDDFAVSPDGQTVYIADDRALAANGGIQRWDSGSQSYILATGAASLVGARGLAVDFSHFTGGGSSGSGAVIYATTAEAVGNRLIKITDSGPSSTASVLATAGVNQLFRGIRFGLNTTGVTILAQPQSQTNYAGATTVFSVQLNGSVPFTYQWISNGVSVAGATSSSFVISNTPPNAAGTYSVTVGNAVTPSIPSSPATLTVLTVGAGISPMQSWIVGANIGARVAFAPAFTGSLPLNIQWSSNSIPIPGATSTSLILTNVQSSYAATYSVIAQNIYGPQVSASATLTVLPGVPAFSTANLIVARVGDGAQTLNTNLGNTLYIDQFTPGGAYVSSTMIPDSGSNALVVAGAPPEGQVESVLTLSSNQDYLNFCGINIPLPNTNGNDVGLSGNPTGNVRGIGALSGTGYYSLCLTNAGLYSAGDSIRACASPDGLINFWTTGGGLGSGPGIKYIAPGLFPNGQGIAEVASGGGSDTRVVEVGVNQPYANFFYTSAQSGAAGLYWAVGGTLETGNTANPLLIASAGSPDDFAISPDTNTIFIADDSPAPQGGVERWDNVGGVYSLSYTLVDGTGTGTNGVRGLVVNWGATTTWGQSVPGAVIYATTAETATNRIIKFSDDGTGSSTASLFAQGYNNEVYRGIRFGPLTVPVSIVTQPVSQSVEVGDTAGFSVTAAGSTPLNYQWQFDGTNIPGATASDFSIPSVAATNAGTYSVSINNGSAPLDSSNATLTVNPFLLTGQLVGWWKLNDASGTAAADSSGNANNGIVTNFPGDNSEWVAGLGAQDALNFANIDTLNDNALQVNDSPVLNFSNNLAFTLAAWVKTSTNTQLSGAAIIAKGYGNGGEQYNLDIYAGAFRFFVRNSAAVVSAITSATAPDNQWEHIAATFDGNAGIMVLYINGQPIGNTAAPNSLQPTAFPLTIGNRYASNTNVYSLGLQGELEDVRIYDVALGASDIQSLYQVLAPPAVPAQFNPAVFLAKGQLQLNFSGAPNGPFRLWSTTNIALSPVTNTWTLLDSGSFSTGGTAAFTDTQATNTDTFYIITEP